MKISKLPTGRYVLAVSGGVDSVVLLDLLSQQSDLELVVAHFNHGIRPDSDEDEVLVAKLASQYNVPFVFERGHLGGNVSEADARNARYQFLDRVLHEQQAAAIVTAHHEDDMLETAIINVLRGTGRKGLSSLQSHDHLLRPLLHASKESIYEYAKTHKLEWREDSTNQDEKYLRNYVRHSIMTKFSPAQREQLLGIISKAKQLNEAIDELLNTELHIDINKDAISRHWFIMLSHSVAREVLLGWLRTRNNGMTLDRKTLEYIVLQAKTLSPGQRISVSKDLEIEVSKERLALKHLDR